LKKFILASAVVLSMAGFVQAPIYAEENNANPPATTEQSNSKEDKKDLSIKNEEETATLPKDKVKEEAPKKEGWQEENKHWRFYENNQPVLKWKKIQVEKNSR
jgi:putative surface protein